jgi:Na+-translocating ferredoxin:NAD+ oxidoreductase RnfG subunit
MGNPSRVEAAPGNSVDTKTERFMQRVLLFLSVALMLVALAACDNAESDAAEAETEGETAQTEQQVSENAIPVENAFKYTHIDGHKEEREFTAFVMFEYEQLETVKYQVAYIMCTCRGPEVNYWSVAFVEINKADGTIASFSMDEDNTGKYTAGLYGDSIKSWDGTPVQQPFYDQFIPNNIIGATEEEIDSYETMHGEADAFTGATVTPNNSMRMLEGLFEYHKRNYGGSDA